VHSNNVTVILLLALKVLPDKFAMVITFPVVTFVKLTKLETPILEGIPRLAGTVITRVSAVAISTVLIKDTDALKSLETVWFVDAIAVFCNEAAVTPLRVVVQVSIVSPLARLEYMLTVSEGLTVGGRVTLEKVKLN
jgi:hypothetical protein